MARTVAIVPHTHWDREWYAPFQVFRLRLVDLLDDLLPLLDRHPSFRHFQLDGQMAMVDDYLEVRPEAEPQLRRLAATGRLSMGPWYTLPDEFLVSGETLVRDLQLGMARAAAFGGAMPVGYLPDMFGHVAQMPQILRQLGFEHAVVWRGVPGAVDKTAFWWSAPDGSTVRAQYLWRAGYGVGSYLPDDAKELVLRIDGHLQELGDALVGDLLWMYGGDHNTPRPELGAIVAEANALQDDLRLEIVRLDDFLRAQPTEGLPEWTGELRSGARANLLMGVASNRVDVKRAAARAERALERVAEPLAALFQPPEAWPQRLLDLAWRQLILNAAHDSICACSADAVVDAVLVRYADATEIAMGLTERALAALGRQISEVGVVVVNPSPRRRRGLVELELQTDEPVPGTQPLDPRPGLPDQVTLSGGELHFYLEFVRSQQLDPFTYLNEVEIDDRGDVVDILLRAHHDLRENLLIPEIKADLLARAEARPRAQFRIRLERPPRQRVLAWVDGVDGFGWRRWEPAEADVHPVLVDGHRLTNGLVTVEVDPEAGTFSLDGVPGYGRLVDTGDHGDTYNWSPPDTDRTVDTPDAVAVEVEERGPLLGRLAVIRRYAWPEEVRDRARAGSRPVEVRTALEVRAGEPFVRVTVAFDNQHRDHRLRVWLPLPEPAAASRAECAFAVVARGLTAEGGPSELGVPTFPSRRFVQAGGLTVVHEGLPEYELVDVDGGGAHALALTLVRATGMLSRVEMTTRPLPAGPPDPVEGSQVQGPHLARFAVSAAPCDPYAMADEAFVPLQKTVGLGTGSLPGEGQALAVSGAEVSSVRRHDGGLEVRVFEPWGEPARVDLGSRTGWLVDLRGEPLEPVEGGFDLAPWQIATVRLDG